VASVLASTQKERDAELVNYCSENWIRRFVPCPIRGGGSTCFLLDNVCRTFFFDAWRRLRLFDTVHTRQRIGCSPLMVCLYATESCPCRWCSAAAAEPFERERNRDDIASHRHSLEVVLSVQRLRQCACLGRIYACSGAFWASILASIA
jgi:hypothetical protein